MTRTETAEKRPQQRKRFRGQTPGTNKQFDATDIALAHAQEWSWPQTWRPSNCQSQDDERMLQQGNGNVGFKTKRGRENVDDNQGPASSAARRRGKRPTAGFQEKSYDADASELTETTVGVDERGSSKIAWLVSSVFTTIVKTSIVHVTCDCYCRVLNTAL